MIGFVFPGQGTVRVGMGGWLRRDPAGAAALDRADAVLDKPVSRLCAKGPLERLVRTDTAQSAVTACNLAAAEVLAGHGVRPDVVAGHSVGEISALWAAGVLDADAALRLVAARSRLMAAVPGTGGMSAVIGLPVRRVAELAAEASAPGEPLVVGLENAADHIVVSGAFAAIERLTGLATDARKIVPLKVGNAFHSPLMAPAVDGWAAAVRAAPMSPPRVPVIPNATAEPTTDLAVLIDALIEQLTAPVRWTESMRRMTGLDGVHDWVEVGDSKVLAGLLRTEDLRCLPMSDPTTPRRLGQRRRAEPVA